MSIDKVTIIQDTMTLPTAGMGFTNPQAPFVETGGYLHGCTYPNAFNDHFLRERPQDRVYKRTVLENRYLRVEFAPEMGGRIWRLYDKTHNYEAAHHNDSVKPYPGGFGGTYVAGGIELNFPFAHSVTNAWPRKSEVSHNADGSATYTVSEWERNGRLTWSMSFTLRPDEARLQQKVMFYNRNKLASSYMYWGNAGVPVDLSSRWVYRESMGSEHGGSTIFYWPFFKGLQMDYYKNNPEVIGIYFLDPHYTFFGKIDTDEKKGLVHYAPIHDVPGKKLWTWGRNSSGENRSWHLSSVQHYFGEVQSGRPVNQEHLEWVAPEEMIYWTEQWSPIYGLTHVTEMTEECAFQLLPEIQKLVAYPVVGFENRRLVFLMDGKPVKEMTFSGTPATLVEIPVNGFTPEELAVLEIRVYRNASELGRIAIKDRSKVLSAKKIREEPIPDRSSSDALTVWGDFSAKLLYRDRALKLYKDALANDPSNPKAHLGLGNMLLFGADFAGARAEFEKAIDCNKWEAEAYLMLSHICLLEGDLDGADDYAQWARYYGLHSRSSMKIAEVAAAAGDFPKAESFAKEAVLYNGTSLKSHALAAMALRKQGRNAEATELLASVPCAPLRDLMWHSERWFLGEVTDDEFQDALFSDEWRCAELALNYAEIAQYDEAAALAAFGVTFHKDGWELPKLFNPERIYGFTRKRENPFLHMILGYIALKQDRAADAKKHFADGDYFELHVNTNQLEMVPILKAACDHGSAYAHFYLGNFYYGSRVGLDAANAEWKLCAQTIADCPQLLRNMASYALSRENDPAKARELLRKAISITPADVYLRNELIAAERACGATPDEVLAIYQAAPEVEKAQFLHARGLLGAYMAANRWEEAAEYLAAVDRSHCDEDSGWYNFAVEYAEHLLNDGKPAEALKWLSKSRPNPMNLSYVNYPEQWIPKHKEFYLTAVAYRELGKTERSREYLEKTMAEPAEIYYFKPIENSVMGQRFWIALAMNDCGLYAAARSLMGCINSWRETQALVRLELEREEVKRWGEKDPLSGVEVHVHAGPEI